MVCLGFFIIMEFYDPNFRFRPETLAITLDTEDLKKFAKAINTETRSKNFASFNARTDGYFKTTQELDLSQANISAQIKILQDTGDNFMPIHTR